MPTPPAANQIGGRSEEARDMARYALRNPWWSLADLAATRTASELAGSAKQVHWQLSEAATAASSAQVTGFNYKEPKTEEQVCACVCHAWRSIAALAPCRNEGCCACLQCACRC